MVTDKVEQARAAGAQLASDASQKASELTAAAQQKVEEVNSVVSEKLGQAKETGMLNFFGDGDHCLFVFY